MFETDGGSAWVGAARQGRPELHETLIPQGAAILPSGAIGFEELIIRRARLAQLDSVDIPTVYLDRNGYAPVAHVRFIGRDSARIRFGADSVVDLRVDAAGRIIRAHYTAAKGAPVHIERVECGVVEALMRERYRVYDTWFRAEPVLAQRKP